MMSFQGLADSLFSHQAPLFGKVAVHNYPRMAQRLTIGARVIDKDAYLQRSYWIPGSYVTSNSMSAGSNALPRLRTLCTNSKNPRYSRSFSWEIPRCGRSQLRKSDQNPSMVLTWTSHKPSPSSSRANSPRP